MMGRFFLMMLCLGITVSPCEAGILVDAINPNAQPEPIENIYYQPFPQIGWYYKPGQDYELTRIESYFDPIPGAPANQTLPITIKLYSDRPAAGGSTLSMATFTAQVRNGGWQGVDFSPISLDDGSQYFLAFEGINGMGINLSTWRTINGVNTLAFGADQSLGAYYFGPTYGSVNTSEFQFSASGVGRVAPTAPILKFYGNLPAPPPPPPPSVPEPGTLTLAGLGIFGLLGARWRKRRAGV